MPTDSAAFDGNKMEHAWTRTIGSGDNKTFGGFNWLDQNSYGVSDQQEISYYRVLLVPEAVRQTGGGRGMGDGAASSTMGNGAGSGFMYERAGVWLGR